MSTPKRPRIVMAGMSNLDHIWQVDRFPPVASRTRARTYRMQGGGPAATAAVAAARLGGAVELVSVHGDDEGGRHARAELEAFGVDCSQVAVSSQAPTPVSAVLVAPSGERYIFPHRETALLDDPGLVHTSRLAGAGCLLCDLRYPRISEVLLLEARRLGVATVADAGNSLNWHLAGYFDYLLVSEECAAEVSEGKPPKEALADLRQFEGQLVGITLGGAGFVYDRGQGAVHLPALEVDAKDTTGAGDVFHGAYCYGVAQGWDSRRCGALAVAAASLSCEGLGRSSIPNLDQVESRAPASFGPP